ncbi:formate dehydrogenase subunit gamma [Aquincola tertiaricarbonis]|uniref:formate dehydrogenase subunit gamma n=1 Tax=Aquincola tertiaricarbonis TaxID=391953 RepID=UPI0009FB2CBB|nr:formate dehydrogenase subunit gamma [Aquincola tertiaricarbonis]
MPSPVYAPGAPVIPANDAVPQPIPAPSVDAAAVRRIALDFEHLPGGLLPALHAVQDALGHVPRDGVPVIAEVFNLSRAEVHGVLTYYHHFRTEPPAGCVVQVCRAESCQAMGADALMAHVQLTLGCGGHGQAHASRSADGRFQVEPVYCLGLCASSPALTIDGEVHARLSSSRFDALIAEKVGQQ